MLSTSSQWVKVQPRNSDAHRLRDTYSDVFGPADTKLDLKDFRCLVPIDPIGRFRWLFRCFPQVTGVTGLLTCKMAESSSSVESVFNGKNRCFEHLKVHLMNLMLLLNLFRLCWGIISDVRWNLYVFCHCPFCPCKDNIKTNLISCLNSPLLFIYIVLFKKGWGAPLRGEGQTGVIYAILCKM